MAVQPPDTRQLVDEAAEQVKQHNDRRFLELQAELARTQAILNNTREAGPWEPLRRYAVAPGASVTDIVFTGLQGDAEVEYLLRGYIAHDGTGGFVKLTPNSASTGLAETRLRGDGTSASSGSGTSAIRVARLTTGGDVSTFDGTLFVKTGQPRLWQGLSTAWSTAAAGYSVEAYGGFWTNTTENVTSLTLGQSGAGTFDEGTYIDLYRRVVWP